MVEAHLLRLLLSLDNSAVCRSLSRLVGLSDFLFACSAFPLPLGGVVEWLLIWDDEIIIAFVELALAL